MTACIDLALAMVKQDLGADIVKSVARKLVVYHRRIGGQSQFSTVAEMEPDSDRVRKALEFAKENLCEPLNVEQLAEHVHWSRGISAGHSSTKPAILRPRRWKNYVLKPRIDD
ncbi:transcriptional activator FtrA [Ewingella americana]|uniref:Transcriptional activator FtrA n=1 Tax=Ewingella americana TaxID=41202 RepID=A0A377NAT5_9GAMM|nr:transcriptional activator FtrA [Ewingella americana]